MSDGGRDGGREGGREGCLRQMSDCYSAILWQEQVIFDELIMVTTLYLNESWIYIELAD